VFELMKKIKMLLAIGAILFLSACSSGISGETTTVCRNVEASRWDIGTTVITIEGMDEHILTWTERTIFDRDAYNNYFWAGGEPSDEDITGWFDSSASQNLDGVTGVNWNLVALDDNMLVTELIYNYGVMSEEALNRIWETENFEREITLTFAIADLEEAGATCQAD